MSDIDIHRSFNELNSRPLKTQRPEHYAKTLHEALWLTDRLEEDMEKNIYTDHQLRVIRGRLLKIYDHLLTLLVLFGDNIAIRGADNEFNDNDYVKSRWL